MFDPRKARTFLFVPGDQSGRFAKTLSTGADAVILDLEDAVAPAAKETARKAVATALASGIQALVRVNAADTRWFDEDLAAVAAFGASGIVLPKAEHAGPLREVAARLPGIPLFPLIESAAGFGALAELAAATPICRFIFGTVDFQVDLGIHGEGEELLAFRSELVLRSRIAGIAAPVDGVSLTIDDTEALSSQSRRARRIGFGGKLCIHPRQVDIVREAFRPSAEEVDRARKIMAAAEAATAGVVVVDGRMVDRPVVEQARRTLLDAAAGASIPNG